MNKKFCVCYVNSVDIKTMLLRSNDIEKDFNWSLLTHIIYPILDPSTWEELPTKYETRVLLDLQKKFNFEIIYSVSNRKILYNSFLQIPQSFASLPHTNYLIDLSIYRPEKNHSLLKTTSFSDKIMWGVIPGRSLFDYAIYFKYTIVNAYTNYGVLNEANDGLYIPGMCPEHLLPQHIPPKDIPDHLLIGIATHGYDRDGNYLTRREILRKVKIGDLFEDETEYVHEFQFEMMDCKRYKGIVIENIEDDCGLECEDSLASLFCNSH